MGEYAGLGGMALTSAIVSREVPPLCHPLSVQNELVIAPGLLSGTAASIG
ncbi:MAG: aldehyde ferredoxin oxidoreductase N-terminal domain-containing protein [Syntrophobacteraceae bacterium]